MENNVVGSTLERVKIVTDIVKDKNLPSSVKAVKHFEIKFPKLTFSPRNANITKTARSLRINSKIWCRVLNEKNSCDIRESCGVASNI
ncbi:MAG: hypothetical protein GX409_10160 [candidate division Zixibacteria bacterium]|nr:hypothetical protein [candidate division Zixibacteria bacterium]